MDLQVRKPVTGSDLIGRKNEIKLITDKFFVQKTITN